MASEIIIYTTEDGLTKVDVTYEDETVFSTCYIRGSYSDNW